MKTKTPESQALDGPRLGILVMAMIFLPLAAGYFLSFLFRSINAMIAPRLVADLGLSPDELQAFNNKRLGERLVAMGLIDEDSLQRATAKQASMPSRPRIGDVLVEMGVIKPEQADFFSKLIVSDDGQLQAHSGNVGLKG